MARVRDCTPEIRRGRLRKATQFLDAAALIFDLSDEPGEVGDAYVTLCVHAGIAASDVICCARLGQHSQGEDHGTAVTLLDRADRGAGRHLRTLLTMKTKAGYSHTGASGEDCRRARRAADTLVESARRTQATGPGADHG